MKICPNCGAENEDNALTCILCEFEFDVEESGNYGNENFTQHDALEHEDSSDMSATTDNLNDYENQAVDHSDNISPEENELILKQHKSKAPIAAIIAIICILIAGSSIFGIMQLMKNKNEKNDNSNIKTTNTSSTDNTSATEEMITTSLKSTKSETTITTTVSVESTTHTTDSNASAESTEVYVQENVKKDEINQIYLNIINETEFLVPHRGFIIDMNNDGVNELIIPDTDTMSFIIYYYKNEKLASQRFGSFMALGNFELFKVNGDNGTNYIYYRDNYAYKSKQGYFSFSDRTQLNIFIDYPENNGSFRADWTIDFNGTENYAKGNEAVDTFYGQPSDCHKKLMSALPHYGFSISEKSKYTTITGMYKDELIKNLSNNDNTEKKPTISAQLTEVPAIQGVTIYMNVSGDYSYYTYESYEYGPDNSTPYSNSGSSSAEEIRITAFSGGVIKVVVNVIPYNSNGVAGDMVSATYTPGSTEANQASSITSCNKFGTIYSPDGSKVDGRTRSYLIDGGSASYERHDLTNGWHILAVNEYYDGSTYWYELYDADDGDYYGWVDGDHINFY